MGDKSGIEWTDATWNPIVGCSIVSPGCTNCYAMKMAARLEKALPATRPGGHLPNHYTDITRKVNGKPVWTGRITIAPDHILTAPLKWRKSRRIFVNSMGDLFHEAVPDEWINRVFAVMALSPQHTFQVLTKRSKRMRDYCNGIFAARRIATAILDLLIDGKINKVITERNYPMTDDCSPDEPTLKAWPLPNVWPGVSAEDQARADERIPDLLATPAAMRFVSAEPLLGPVDFTEWLHDSTCEYSLIGPGYDVVCTCSEPREVSLDWIVAGGESGPGARPMHPDWPRSIRDQCAAAGVPFFFKQWGEWAWSPDEYSLEDADIWAANVFGRNLQSMELTEGHMAYRVGKARAGRLLDGIEHNAMPEVK